MKRNLLYILIAIILGIAAYVMWNDKNRPTSGTTLSDFAIEDTASIGRIEISDGQGGRVTLKRGDGEFWSLNDTFKAMPHNIQLLLNTFANTGVQSPVAVPARDNIMKLIMRDNRKVQVKDLDGNWIKTWYVGGATPSNQGTYAILETPEEGLSPEPLIIEVRGFRGYLTPRFHTIVKDWRWSGVFSYPLLDMQEIRVDIPKSENQGFRVSIPDERMEKMNLMTLDGEVIPANMIALSTFVESFKMINIESFETGLSAAGRDSVLNLLPDVEISVTDHEGGTDSCRIYFIPRKQVENPEETQDVERLLVYFDGNLCTGQVPHFSKIIRHRSDFLAQ